MYCNLGITGRNANAKTTRRHAKLSPKGLAIANLEHNKADGKRRQDDREEQLELNDACCREAEEGGQPVGVVVPQVNQGKNGRVDGQRCECVGPNINRRENDDGVKAETNRSDQANFPVKQFAGRAIEQVDRSQHGKNGRDPERDLAHTHRFGPQPKQARIRRGIGPHLARHDACETTLDQVDGYGLIQPKGGADGNEPDRNRDGKSQSVDRVLHSAGIDRSL
jgi:hypothetical protein